MATSTNAATNSSIYDEDLSPSQCEESKENGTAGPNRRVGNIDSMMREVSFADDGEDNCSGGEDYRYDDDEDYCSGGEDDKRYTVLKSGNLV